MCRFVLGDLWNAEVFPTTQFDDKKGLSICDALLRGAYTLQSALVRNQDARIVQIDLSATFDGVNHQGILIKLCSAGVSGSALNVLTQFLSHRSQYVMAWWMIVGGNWLT